MTLWLAGSILIWICDAALVAAIMLAIREGLKMTAERRGR